MNENILEKTIGFLLIGSGLLLFVNLAIEYQTLYEVLESYWGGCDSSIQFKGMLAIIIALNVTFGMVRILFGCCYLNGAKLSNWKFYTLASLVLLGGDKVGIALTLLVILVRNALLFKWYPKT